MSPLAGWAAAGALTVVVAVLVAAALLGWLDARCEAAGHRIEDDGRCTWCGRRWPPGRCPETPVDTSTRQARAQQRPGGSPSP